MDPPAAAGRALRLARRRLTVKGARCARAGQPIVDFGVVLRADAVEVDLGAWPNLQRVVAEAWQKLAAAWTGSRTLGGRSNGPTALGEHSPT